MQFYAPFFTSAATSAPARARAFDSQTRVTRPASQRKLMSSLWRGRGVEAYSTHLNHVHMWVGKNKSECKGPSSFVTYEGEKRELNGN